jgi:acetyl-CoA carboxylase, biotin carboxylase subunit
MARGEDSLKRILIANRGEIARRIITTCKQLEIETVAVYSEADSELPYVKEADDAICIGKGPVKDSYLNMEKIIEVATNYNVEAIHPGYGLLSENGDFVKRIEQAGITFIGPNADILTLMGDKISARRAMVEAGVPVVPGSDGGVTSVSEAIQVAKEIGYPVMLKASGGGGGIGMVLCKNEQELSTSFSKIQSRAKAYFNSESVFLEKFIPNARHIEVQIFGDQNGNVIHLYERNCSVQRRNQKVIEETHSPNLSEQTREKLYEAAKRAAKAVSYTNAGTVEFIVDEAENIYFLEMNTRLQVEHPVTERICGIDLVEWQIKIAKGLEIPLQQESIKSFGHAIEFRVYAENPNNFYPSPGKISTLNWGNQTNIRIDSGYEQGNTVTPFYDPLIAKVIVHEENREQCLQVARSFFKETKISGIQTNIPLFLHILENPDFKRGSYSTNLLKQMVTN